MREGDYSMLYSSGIRFKPRVLQRLFVASFLICLYASLSACAHGPWDIDSYIQALERAERAEYQKPDEVLSTLNIKPGIAIADIGAGSGYFTRRFAQEVGEAGKVFAIDVEQKMLDYNQKEINKLGLSNRTEFILTQPGDPSLQDHSVDLIFFCNAYHHLENHSAYLTKAKSALKTNGRIVIIDFYHDERSGKLSFPKHHLVPKEQVIEHMKQAGLILSKEHTFLPRQYFLEFVPDN